MVTDSTAKSPRSVSDGAHPRCVVCGAENACGMHLAFALLDDGSVEAAFPCGDVFQGYPGLVHGGVISSLLDGAMTNCLFAHGQQGITGELKVRFCYPVRVNRRATVRARIDRSTPPLHVLEAELVQDDQVKARATGKFVQRSYFESREGNP